MIGYSQGTVAKFFGPHHEFLQRGCPIVKRIVAVTVKLGIVHEKPLIRLAIPAFIGEIFIDYQLLPGSKANSVIKA